MIAMGVTLQEIMKLLAFFLRMDYSLGSNLRIAEVAVGLDSSAIDLDKTIVWGA
jgi:hypothetical protein